MANKNDFVDLIAQGYQSKGESITLGAAMLGDETLTGSLVNIPLKTINRHGLFLGQPEQERQKLCRYLLKIFLRKVFRSSDGFKRRP